MPALDVAKLSAWLLMICNCQFAVPQTAFCITQQAERRQQRRLGNCMHEFACGRFNLQVIFGNIIGKNTQPVRPERRPLSNSLPPAHGEPRAA